MRHSLSRPVLVGALIALVLVAGATLVLLSSRPTDHVVAQDVGAPYPPFNPWLDDSGRFYSPMYDDRRLSAEQKAANPVFNPQWEPFASCMETAGVAVRAPAERFAQSHLDALFVRLNEENPDPEANKLLDMNDDPGGLTGAFLVCARETLAA